MTERKLYLYKHVIEYPEGADEWSFHGHHWYNDVDEVPGWARPQVEKALRNEVGTEVEIGFRPDSDGYICVRVPTLRRGMFSLTSAKARAAIYEQYGAKVKIVRSLPVEWPEPSD